MRLLELLSEGDFRLTERLLHVIPQYAILSHTWGDETQEVTFHDVVKGSGQHKDGYKKIKFCGEQAAKDGFQYVWIDSCCIDRSSSAVLSESINSMFRWYKSAAKCYVYLADVSTNETDMGNAWESAFRKSRWFTRGWTLQELLAPTLVEFFSSDGKRLGDRESLQGYVHQITGISPSALQGRPLHKFSISEKKTWGTSRTTTIPEDEAYCLMGIFDVSMATRYGEGKEKALERLDSKIKKAHMAAGNARVIGNEDIDKRRDAILRWLSSPDPSSSYQKALKLRQPDTGLWFLESEQYASWKASPSSFAWLHGIPGCGKTILSSTIIENVLYHCTNDPGKVAAYFYFDFNDLRKQSSELMLKSLIAQLFRQCDRIPSALNSLFVSGQQMPSVDSILHVLQQIIETQTTTYVILDALDECSDRAELMDAIDKIAGWRLENLHVLVASRSERDIESSLEFIADGCTVVPLQRAVVDNDIRKYVHHRLSVDKSLKKWQDDKVRNEIETAMMAGARGMYVHGPNHRKHLELTGTLRFRWAVCQLDTLGKCVNRAKVRKALKELPRTLDATYERVLCAIDEENAIYAVRILQWLAFSSRPLYVEEVAEVVALDHQRRPVLNKEEILEDPLDALSICSSLLTIRTSSDWDFLQRGESAAGSGRVISLAHYSVKEYLISERIRQGPARSYGLQERSSNVIIAKCCIGYLLQFTDTESFCRETVTAHKLARYSAEHWINHARSYPAMETQELIMELFSIQNGAYINWIRIYNFDELRLFGMTQHAEAAPPPLYYASLVGLSETVRCLLQDVGVGIDARGGGAGTALQAASAEGHKSIVELLIDKGANVNAQGNLYSNALQAASIKGHESIVELLLEKGADVNAQIEKNENALCAASARGYKQVAKLLLDKGAHVNAQSSRHGSALQAASFCGHESVVKLLLDYGADIDMLGGENGNALIAASYRCHQSIVRLLLDKGANINATGGLFGNALQAASEAGQVRVVKLLLDRGADVNAQGGVFGNALQAASFRGHETVVELLLDSGAAIDAQGGLLGCAKQAALIGNQDFVVEILRSKALDRK